MGVINHLLVAHPSEANAVAASPDPSQNWEGVFCRGLDRIKLCTLWALLESGSTDDRFEERLDQVRTIPEGDQGPWVDIIPTKMLSALASIAAMEEDEQESIAEAWGAPTNSKGGRLSEILDVVHVVGDLAESAQLEDKTLLIWTSL